MLSIRISIRIPTLTQSRTVTRIRDVYTTCHDVYPDSKPNCNPYQRPNPCHALEVPLRKIIASRKAIRVRVTRESWAKRVRVRVRLAKCHAVLHDLYPRTLTLTLTLKELSSNTHRIHPILPQHCQQSIPSKRKPQPQCCFTSPLSLPAQCTHHIHDAAVSQAFT